MIWFIVILIVALLIFLFWKNTTENKTSIETVKRPTIDNSVKSVDTVPVIYDHTDEDGRKYHLVKKTVKTPRKTYIKAYLKGKYWGELDEHFSSQFGRSDYYDFNLYEVQLTNAIYKAEEPFVLEKGIVFPRERLPEVIKTTLEKDGITYGLNLHEPILGNVKIDQKLHQVEGNEVFGVIEADVIGYILDFVDEIFFEKVFEPVKEIIVPTETQPSSEEEIYKTLIPTGKVEFNGDYKKVEYYYSNYKDRYWGDWKNTKQPVNPPGCFSSLIGFFSLLLGLVFIVFLLPSLAYFIPIFLFLFLLNLIPSKFFIWLFRVIGLLFLLFFLTSLFHFFRNSTSPYTPSPTVVEMPLEADSDQKPIVDTVNNIKVKDTLISHYRKWKDYDGTLYEGKIWTRKSDYINSKNYKQSLSLNESDNRVYDEMIYMLKENDKNHLEGVYQLFDKIRREKKLTDIKFAEMMVSFVQDIPYAAILPADCNPSQYDDQFIKDYLTSKNARCDGFEKFGINTPVEFMSNLNGDCDTRTLLLYTMLAHYGYDVALFSSEYYSHSIIGINLPIDGIAYRYQNQRYVLWETTAPGIKAGILPEEISNLNYWRISLKSK